MTNTRLSSGRAPTLEGYRGDGSADRATYLVALACLLFALCINALILFQDRVDPLEIYRDPLMVASQMYGRALDPATAAESYCCPNASLWGAASNLGVVIWFVTAGAVAMGAVAALRDRFAGRDADAIVFFAVALAMTTLLGLDDLFQIHEEKALFGSLKGEAILFPLYGLLLAAYALSRTVRRSPDKLLLAAAALAFGASVLADQFLPQEGMTVVIEDAAKLFGIAFWAGFHVLSSARAILEPVPREACGGEGASA